MDVYALPAGASGTFDDDFLSIVTDGPGGRFRLRLPSPGRFDVFARTPHLIVHAKDVTVPGTDSVRLALPRLPIATFVLDPESPPDGNVTCPFTCTPMTCEGAWRPISTAIHPPPPDPCTP